MYIVRNWLHRRKWHSFAVRMKKHQADSSTFIGVTDFYVSAFDVSARSAIENGTSGLQSLKAIMSKCTTSKQKKRGGTLLPLI
jgi:hypothetical protein